jgi:biotin transport system permease protein
MFASLGRATLRAKPLLIGLALASVLIGLFHLYMQQPMVGAVSVLRLLCTTLMGIALTITTRYTDLLGVLDVDSSALAAFDEIDAQGLEAICALIGEA